MKRFFVALAASLLMALPAQAADSERYADIEDQLADLQATVADLSYQVTNGLKLNGYFDFEYMTDSRPNTPSYFRQHHLTLFVSKNWDRWRVFGEMEYEDGTKITGSGGTQVVGTTAPVTGKGQVNLERAWLEYLHSDTFNLRMGKLLLPHYWNVNHYPNTVLTTMRPLMVRNLFPSDSTGLMAHGTAFTGSVGATYHLYTGNGAAANNSKQDDNDNKAIGGHLRLHLGDAIPGFSRLDLGISHHNERSPIQGGSMDVTGADLQLTAGPVELLSEYARRHDNTHEGIYLQPSVSLTDTIDVVYRYDWLDDVANPTVSHTLGAAWRPMPNLTLKISISNVNQLDPTQEDCEHLDLSAAIFF